MDFQQNGLELPLDTGTIPASAFTELCHNCARIFSDEISDYWENETFEYVPSPPWPDEEEHNSMLSPIFSESIASHY
jgi:hypothetical protein